MTRGCRSWRREWERDEAVTLTGTAQKRPAKPPRGVWTHPDDSEHGDGSGIRLDSRKLTWVEGKEQRGWVGGWGVGGVDGETTWVGGDCYSQGRNEQS